MKKKLVSVLMCMAMGATLLAGCGSEEAADSSNTTAADAADADTAADSEAAELLTQQMRQTQLTGM